MGTGGYARPVEPTGRYQVGPNRQWWQFMADEEPEGCREEVYLPARRPNGHFQRGFSGNPTGRPKLAKEVKDMLSGLTPLAVQALADGLRSEDERVRLVAAQQILDRTLGKPAPAERDAGGGNNGQAHIQALLSLAANPPPQHAPPSNPPPIETTDEDKDDDT